MVEWQRVPVAAVAVSKGLVGGPFGSSLGGKDYVPTGVPVIRGTNLGSLGKFSPRGFVYVTPEKAHGQLARNLAVPGDVIFTQRGTLGQVGLVPEEPYEEYVISQSQMRLRVNRDAALPEFVYYQFRSPEMVAEVHSRAIATGVPHINLGILSKIEVSLPPLKVQQGIVELLGALDDKIAVNERIALTYERLLQSQIERMGIEVDPDPASAVAVTEFVHFNPKVARPSSEAVYVDMAALSTHRAGISAWARREPKGGTRFVNGDTLLARITPCLENGKTGYVDFMENSEIGVGSTEFIVMRSVQGVPPEFSYFLARSKRFREHAIRNMVGSSGRQRVAAADAADFYIDRPDRQMLAAFGETASDAFAHMRSLDRESRILTALRDTLLPQLMSGKLRVREAEKIVEDAV